MRPGNKEAAIVRTKIEGGKSLAVAARTVHAPVPAAWPRPVSYLPRHL